MVQGYYTLAEAAEVIGMPTDELKQLAQKNKIRSFQDRGTLRFRIQDIQELQRQRLGDSDPELRLAPKSPKPKPTSGAKPRTPKPELGKGGEGVIDFEIDDRVDIGSEPIIVGDSSAARKKGPKSGPRTPKAGSGARQDSQESRDADSDVQLGELDAKKGSSRKSSSGAGRKVPSPADSGVRLVPMEKDSDVRIAGPGSNDEIPIGESPRPDSNDSDVRLERASDQSHDNMLQTEEINLDEEIKKQEAVVKKPAKFQPPKSGFQPAPASPFELSDSDVNDVDAKSKTTDFEMAPAVGNDSEEEFSLELSEDVDDERTQAFAGPKSGINLSKPTDRGVSLEAKDGSSDDFELSLDAPTPKTPKPGRKEPDSASEFELSLDFDSGTEAEKKDEGSSEFELSLDLGEEPKGAKGGKSGKSGKHAKGGKPAKPDTDSDSFELSLDDGALAKDAGGEKDIFESDFELPAAGEPSDDSTVDAGSSDFELALDDSDIATDDESGSQVVALEEDEVAEEGAETVTGDEGDIEVDEEEEPRGKGRVREKVVIQEVVQDRWIKPAPWGWIPTAVMFPCVIVTILAGIMGFEMIQSTTGFKSSGIVTKQVSEMFGFNKMK